MLLSRDRVDRSDPTSMKLIALVLPLFAMTPRVLAQSPEVAPAINQFGLDLLRIQPSANTPGNLLLSPYSIEAALAMAWTGADGVTRDEMRRVLHFAGNDAAVVNAFSALARELRAISGASPTSAEIPGQKGIPVPRVDLSVANRLFAQSGFAVQPEFIRGLRDDFGAPLEELDFSHAPEPSRRKINDWVADQTHRRITDLVPAGALNEMTRLVLANAIYLKAPWMTPFEPEATKPEAFWVGGSVGNRVPTMQQQDDFHFGKRSGYSAIALPYEGGALQFLILLPDERNGLARFERIVTPALLAECTRLPSCDVVLHLPRFKLEPPSMPLGSLLKRLGMTTASDQPPGSADFSRMAQRKPNEYLCVSEVIHKAWLALDEAGTEAAAATATVMMVGCAVPSPRPPPIEVRVDHPFLFAIQHVPSGACLFLGRVEDPR